MKNYLNRRNLFKLGAAAIVSIPFLQIDSLLAEEELAWDACPTVVPRKIQEACEKMGGESATKIRSRTRQLVHTKSTKKVQLVETASSTRQKSKTFGKLVGERGGYAKCSMLDKYNTSIVVLGVSLIKPIKRNSQIYKKVYQKDIV